MIINVFFRSTVARLEHAVSSLRAEKDMITSDHQLLLLAQHQYETRSLELTNQITTMAHERENMEAKLRQVSKQFDEKHQANEKLLDKSRLWETEKQVDLCKPLVLFMFFSLGLASGEKSIEGTMYQYGQ